MDDETLFLIIILICAVVAFCSFISGTSMGFGALILMGAAIAAWMDHH